MATGRSRTLGASLGALLLFLSTTGCESLAERGKYLTSASAFEWERERFKVAGQDEMWGQVGVYEGKLSFFAKGFPPGTQFTVGGVTATAGDDGNAQLDAPAVGLYGVLPFGTIEMPTVEGATMTVAAPGATALEVPLPSIRVSFAGEVLLAAAKGPVLFAGEEPGDGPIANIVFNATAQEPTVIGTAPKTFADVDAVAIMTIEPTGETVECTGYVDDAGNALPTVALELAHTTIAVHARRTGKQLATKRFDPVRSCPESFTKWSDESKTRLQAYIPTGEIEPWLESVVAAQ